MFIARPPSFSTDGKVGVWDRALGRIVYQSPGTFSIALGALRVIGSQIVMQCDALREEIQAVREKPRPLSMNVLGNPAEANQAREEMRLEIQSGEQAARGKALEGIANIRTSSEALAKQASKEIAARLFSRPETKDTAELLLRETREQRAWSRVSPLLSQSLETDGLGFKTLGAIAFEAAAAGDVDTIAALLAEVPSWAKANKQPVDAMQLAVEDAILKASPERKDAIEARRELAKGMAHLVYSLNMVEHAISTQVGSAVLCLWAPDTTQTVALLPPTK